MVLKRLETMTPVILVLTYFELGRLPHQDTRFVNRVFFDKMIIARFEKYHETDVMTTNETERKATISR